MLYDPKWEKPEVKADPFSLESLIAWLETKPADGVYCWTNMGECLLAQWAQSMDRDARPSFAGPCKTYEYIIGGVAHDLVRYSDIACSRDLRDTFGAALKRARAALSAR